MDKAWSFQFLSLQKLGAIARSCFKPAVLNAARNLGRLS
jgi:hypothetical protein